MIKMLIVLFTALMCAYSQDSLSVTGTISSPVEYDTRIRHKVDSLEQLFNKEKERIDNLYTHSYTLSRAKVTEYYISGKLQEINSLYENSKRLEKEANKILYRGQFYSASPFDTYETLIGRSEALKAQADSAMLVLNKDFPISGRINSSSNFNIETFVRSRNIIKGAGVFQLLTGAAGLIVTIVDATRQENIITEEPVYTGRVKTGTKEVIVGKRQHEWGIQHTIYTILSGGLIVSGIITINF